MSLKKLISHHWKYFRDILQAGINNYSQDKLQLKRIGVNPSDSVNTLILKIFLNILNDKFR